MKYLVAALMIFSVNAADASIKNAMSSTCRINVVYTEHEEIEQPDGDIITKKTDKQAVASGVVYNEYEGRFWIITAGHVLKKDNIKKISAEFFFNGKATKPIVGRQDWVAYKKDTNMDLAIFSIPADGLDIKPIPFADRDAVLKKDQTVFSCGCPEGGWPTAWMGHVVENYVYTFKFRPKPHAGRSGSGIFTEDGKSLLGIIIWQDGTAVSIKGVYHYTKWNTSDKIVK